MSVSSISSSSIQWEEYLERQKKLQQQTTREVVSNGSSGAASVPATNPAELLAELQSLQEDPEKLKARAYEMALQVANEAENANGPHAKMLKDLSSELSAIAESGDLSALEEKVSQASSRAKPAGMKFSGPGGMSGGTGASIKWIEALVDEEDEDDEDDEVSLTETLEEYLAELEENESDESSGAALNLKDIAAENAAAKLQTRLTSRWIEIYAQQQAQYSQLSLSA
ncbi:MAG: hypothetical protein LBJ36_07125 [Synergistaceae bacterium]|jgi:hypothetical protein|nr:hypothetical protein [Synergistaceae bacterium]